MTPEQRKEIARLLNAGEDISPEWARVLFPPEKREYELVYHGKEREEDIIADTLAVPLQPVRTFGRNGVDWHNMLIFGDNLQIMKTLLEMKKEGKLCNADGSSGVRLIYIDPPFATKQEFRGTEDQKAYQDKIYGARFLEFLRKRLVLMRELLTEDGSIYVHLDWKKGHYIKILLDEILGENNYQNDITWYYANKIPDSRKSLFTKSSDFIYFYSKKDGSQIFNPQYFDVEPHKRAKEIKVNGVKQSVRDKDGNVVYQTYDKRLVDCVWNIPSLAGTSGEKVDYPTQKPEALLERVLRASSNPGDIIFDAFSGSGTTLAVAEKLGRRWIGVDCGKLAVYTIQKRMLNLCCEMGNKGKRLESRPFTLYNAGLYDFSKLKELPWEDWRRFALMLFQCRDEGHKIGGIEFDGYRQGSSVMVFNHMDVKHKNARLTEDSIQEIHEAVGSKISNKVFIIAPALTFDFQQDYIDFDGVRYYALRIPYSIIQELHRREFSALKQPADEMAVNDTVESVGFDFIRTPELQYETGVEKLKGDSGEYGFIKIKTFRSDAVVRDQQKKKSNLETLSMVMIDFNYDETSRVFDLDDVQYAVSIEQAGWKVRFCKDQVGDKMMAVFLDLYGNEARVLIDGSEFGKKKTHGKAKAVLKKRGKK